MSLSDAEISQLTEDARRARIELDKINERVSDVTAAMRLATDVFETMRKRNDYNAVAIKSANILVDLVYAEHNRLGKQRDQKQIEMDALRAHGVPAINDALQTLMIGGISFS